MLRPISPELVFFSDFWVSGIPRYFCFASRQWLDILHYSELFAKDKVTEQYLIKTYFMIYE